MKRMRGDQGLGLVEVVVSMLIVTLIFMALAGLLIRALTATVENGTRATAAQLAQERLELAREEAVTGDCTNVEAVVEAVVDTEDGRGVPLTVTGVLSNCTQVGPPHDDPKLALVTVTVTTTQPGYSNPVAEVSSNVYVAVP